MFTSNKDFLLFFFPVEYVGYMLNLHDKIYLNGTLTPGAVVGFHLQHIFGLHQLRAFCCSWLWTKLVTIFIKSCVRWKCIVQTSVTMAWLSFWSSAPSIQSPRYRSWPMQRLSVTDRRLCQIPPSEAENIQQKFSIRYINQWQDTTAWCRPLTMSGFITVNSRGSLKERKIIISFSALPFTILMLILGCRLKEDESLYDRFHLSLSRWGEIGSCWQSLDDK